MYVLDHNLLPLLFAVAIHDLYIKKPVLSFFRLTLTHIQEYAVFYE